VPSLGAFLPNAVAVKSIENDLRKSSTTLMPEMMVKLTTGTHALYHTDPTSIY
jgi:hypothetical protein